MKKLLAALLVVGFTAGVILAEDKSCPAAGAEPGAKGAGMSAGKGGVKKAAKSMQGEVSAIDLAANTITLKNKKGTETFAIAPDAKVRCLGKKAAPADIMAGCRVKVEFKEVDGKKVVSAIHCKKNMNHKEGGACPSVKKDNEGGK